MPTKTKSVPGGGGATYEEIQEKPKKRQRGGITDPYGSYMHDGDRDPEGAAIYKRRSEAYAKAQKDGTLDAWRKADKAEADKYHAKQAELATAYEKLSAAMSGKAPPPKKPDPAATNVVPSMAPRKREGPKSSVSTRDQYARAMNSGDRVLAAKLYDQMMAEEAAARKAGK